MKKTLLVAGILALLALFCAAVYFLVVRPGSATQAPPPHNTGLDMQDKESVPGTLPPEPKFVLPDGATAVNDYAFIADGEVYLRSIKSTDSFAVPDSDAATFRSLDTFKTFVTDDIVRDCGGGGQYTFFGDSKHLYFYQVWRTPSFRSSQIEVVVGSDAGSFGVLGDHRYTDGANTFTLDYKVSSSTCVYFLDKRS